MLVKRTMNLEEVHKFYEASVLALDNGSPIKTPIFKTLDKIRDILNKEGEILKVSLEDKVEKYGEDGKPVFKEGVLEEDYIKIINESRAKEVEIEITCVKETDNYILPNGQRIRLSDYLEKAVNIPSKTFALLNEYYIKH